MTRRPFLRLVDHVVALDASQLATVALKSDGTVWGWGDNLYG